MVTNVIDTLNNAEIEILISGLKSLTMFFDSKK
jgi:hypothetical protein